jgi:hypothetical protein
MAGRAEPPSDPRSITVLRTKPEREPEDAPLAPEPLVLDHSELNKIAVLEAALTYASHGRPVFPGNGTEKKPHWEPETLEHGHLDASTDIELVRRWFTNWRRALVCSPVPPDQTCLDFDPRKGGTRHALESAIGPIPDTLTVWSGRDDGGCHLLFARPAGVRFSISPAKLKKHGLDGIDLKDGGKGYTVLPPSLHPQTGKRYRWEPLPVAEMTRNLIDFLKVEEIKPRPVITIKSTIEGGLGSPSGKLNRKALASILRMVANETEGNRQKLGYWAANRLLESSCPPGAWDLLEEALRRSGADEHDVRTALRDRPDGRALS